MLTRMQQNRNPYTLLGGMQISTTIMESNMEILQKAKDRTLIGSSETTPLYIQRNISQDTIEILVYQCSLQH
jgi:hypothetical protein